MHIPENYLSPSTCAVMTAAMVPVWVHAVKKVKETVPREKMPLLGVGGAFSFVGMMFNVPLPGGTTGHAVGGTLIALLLGPDAACLSVSIALLLQALLFGDGGILAYGANCFNMAFVLPYVGYGVYRLLLKRFQRGKSTGAVSTAGTHRGRYLAAGIGSYVGINAAAFCAAVEFGIQPILFHDAAGQALYCPYGLNLSIPAMMIGHLTVFGAVEVIFTVAIYSFVMRTSPGLVAEADRLGGISVPAGGGAAPSGTSMASNGRQGDNESSRRKGLRPVLVLLGVLVCLVPLGLLAQGTAWGEWGSDEIASVVSKGTELGYTPEGMKSGFDFTALMPDYSIKGLPDAVGYIVCAVIGVALTIIIFRIIAASMKPKTNFASA